MDRNLEKLAADSSVRLIAALAAEAGVCVYLAGGGPRDSLLERPVNDLDFALSGAFAELPRRFSAAWGGTFFWLDEERLQARVVKKAAGETLVCDFAPLRGATIEADLRLRDFTINAMAVPVTAGPVRLIDPLGGVSDLREGIVRACAAGSFDDDPLRLLRAHRFAAELGFALEEGTRNAVRQKRVLLAGVAAERVRDELFRILDAPGIRASLERLDDTGLLPVLFPGALFPFDAGRAIDDAAAVELVCGELVQAAAGSGGRLRAYLDGEVEGGIALLSLMKLAACIGAAGKAGIPLLAERLRLGRKATRLLGLFCVEERDLFAMLGQGASERSLFRFFRDREPAGPGMTILAQAAGVVSPTLASGVLRYFFEEYDPTAGDLFLSGEDIMGIAGIGAGKRVGEVLEALRDAESRGLVNDREEAVRFVKNLLTREPPMR